MRIYIIIFISFFSCRNNDIPQNNGASSAETNTSKSKVEKSGLFQDTIVNDQFVYRFIDHDLKIGNFKSKFAMVSKKAIKNIHDNTIVDTIVKYAKSKDTIILYKASGKEMITHLVMRGQNLIYLPTIANIGLNKQDFLNYLKVKDAKTIFISDTENGSVIALGFRDGKLSEVQYKMIYLD